MGNLLSSNTSAQQSHEEEGSDQEAEQAAPPVTEAALPSPASMESAYIPPWRPSHFRRYRPLLPSVPADITSDVTMDESAWWNRKITTYFCVAEGTYWPARSHQRVKVALKVFRLQEEREGKELPQEFKSEVWKLTELRHRNLLPYFGIVQMDCPGPAFVIPWMEQNVVQYITAHPEVDRLLLMKEMSEGLAYLHSLNPPIAHANLKGPNIWIDAHGHARLADYGLLRWWDISREVTVKARNASEARWFAPERLDPKWVVDAPEGYAPDFVKADMWSWGMTVYEMIMLKEPYWKHRHLFSYVMPLAQGKWPAEDGPWTKDEDEKTKRVRELAQRCWVQPKDRPKIADVIAELCTIMGVSAGDGENDHCFNEIWGGPALVPLPAQIFSEHIHRDKAESRFRSSSADIWQARYTEDGEPERIVALKHFWPYVRLLQDDRKEEVQSFVREARRWRALKHPNVVPFLGTVLMPRTGPCFVYGWTPSGNILQYLAKHPAASKRDLVIGIASGLDYLHTRSPPVVHGNLQASKILMSESGEPRLSDYGLLLLMDRMMMTEARPMDHIRHQAPERLNPEQFGLQPKEADTPAADMFSFGMLLYELLAGEKPYHPMKNGYTAMKNILNGIWPDIPAEWDQDEETAALSGVIRRCWSLDRAQRPSARAVVDMLS